MRTLKNIIYLGMKELRSLMRDKAMLALIVFAFTVSIYSSATVTSGSLHLAPIAIAGPGSLSAQRAHYQQLLRALFSGPGRY